MMFEQIISSENKWVKDYKNEAIQKLEKGVQNINDGFLKRLLLREEDLQWFDQNIFQKNSLVKVNDISLWREEFGSAYYDEKTIYLSLDIEVSIANKNYVIIFRTETLDDIERVEFATSNSRNYDFDYKGNGNFYSDFSVLLKEDQKIDSSLGYRFQTTYSDLFESLHEDALDVMYDFVNNIQTIAQSEYNKIGNFDISLDVLGSEVELSIINKNLPKSKMLRVGVTTGDLQLF